MTGILVDVELKVLVVVEEASPDLVHGEVVGVLLRQKIVVVSMRERRLYLDDLT